MLCLDNPDDDPFIRFNVNHPNVPLTWGDVFTAPIMWDNDIPHIDPAYLKERGFR